MTIPNTQREADELLTVWQNNRHLPPADRLKETAMEYSAWIAEVKAKFPVAEEYELAAAIYSFASAFEDGMSPEAAFNDFDRWTSFEGEDA